LLNDGPAMSEAMVALLAPVLMAAAAARVRVLPAIV
jgi:hypothetical protein